MTSSGVIPRPEDRCRLCHGTGWMTVIGHDGAGYEIACTNGCPTAPQPLGDDIEVPY